MPFQMKALAFELSNTHTRNISKKILIWQKQRYFSEVHLFQQKQSDVSSCPLIETKQQ